MFLPVLASAHKSPTREAAKAKAANSTAQYMTLVHDLHHDAERSLLLAATLPAFSQTASIKIDRVSEPPELTGEPKKVDKPSEADSQLLEIIGHLKGQDETKSTLPKLDQFIAQHPGYSDAYFLRATCQACILNSREFGSISNDVRAAMSHPAQVYNK